jgi:PAS domain S-box-containing protein
MATSIRAFDWSATTLGPIDDWPQSLKTVVDLMLATPQPAIIGWGPDLVLLYNGDFTSLLGAQHPVALGLPCPKVWPESWTEFQHEADAVMAGQSLRLTFPPRSLERPTSETTWSSSWTPIRREDGSVGGFYGVAIETTSSSEERLLAASEAARAQVTATLESIGDAFYALDGDFRLTYVNAKAEALWGRPRDTLIGRDLWSEFPQAIGGGPHAQHLAAMRDRRPAHFDGFSPVLGRWMEASLYPDPVSGGLACYFRDVTERRAAEAALRESEARLAHDLEATQVLQNISNQLISKPGVNGHFDELCEAARVLMRSDCASIQVYDDVTAKLELVGHVGFHPDSAAFWDWVDAGVGSSCGRALANEERVIVPDMDLFDADPLDVEAYRRSDILSVQSAPLVARTGQVVGMMSTHWHRRDATAEASYRFFDILARLAADFIVRIRADAALRESEERQRLTVELVPALLWSASPHGQEVTLNEGWLAYTGQSENETQNFGWLNAVHPDDLPLTRAAFDDAFSPGGPLERQQRIWKAGDGWRWHLVRQVPVRDEDGAITRWFGAAVDIHESKLAEQALRETELRLQSLIEGVPQLVFRAVDGGNWTWASSQWSEFTGQAEPDSHGWGWLDPVHPEDRERVNEIWAGAVERGSFEADYRIFIRVKTAIAGSKRAPPLFATTAARSLSGLAHRRMLMICEDCRSVSRFWSPNSSIARAI